jgi:hypothetical protein
MKVKVGLESPFLLKLGFILLFWVGFSATHGWKEVRLVDLLQIPLRHLSDRLAGADSIHKTWPDPRPRANGSGNCYGNRRWGSENFQTRFGSLWAVPTL